MIDEIIKHGDEVLNKTPEMLPVLKQAGVVDSGGQGLVQVLKGAYDALIGKEIDYTIEGAPTGAAPAKISAETEAEIKFGYCTEFIIVLNAPMSDNEEHAYKAFLESIGDSIVVVADDEIVKTHVHTNDPGLALQKALTFGSLSKITICVRSIRKSSSRIHRSLQHSRRLRKRLMKLLRLMKRQITCLQRKWALYLFQSEKA